MGMYDKLKQINDLRKKQGELQRELEQEIVEVEAGDGTIVIEINGAQKVTRIAISRFPATTEELNRLLTEAVNKAISESQKIATEKGKVLFRDLGLPGL